MKIPTTAELKTIKTAAGTLWIRRAARSAFNTILRAAKFNGEVHDKAILIQLVVQWAVVELVGGSLPKEKHPELGEIAAADVYDAMSEEEAIAIFRYASEGAELPEAMAGN